MAKKTTLLEFQTNLKKMSKDLGKAIRKPFREHQRTIRAALIAEYWKHGLGAKIWKWRQRKFDAGGGPSVKLGSGRRPKYPRWSQSNQAWIAPVTVKGMAAKIEKSGRLNRRNKRGVGAVLRRRPVFNRIVDKEFDRTVRDVSKSFAEFIERTL